MELGIFITVVVFGFGSFLIYKLYMYSSTIKSQGRDRNYYYNRFIRNKEQVERYIETLQHNITLFNCGEELFTAEKTLMANEHLANLKMDYVDDYTDVTQKILKRGKLSRKDKKLYIRLLSKQSEKLYNVEKVLRAINDKYKS